MFVLGNVHGVVHTAINENDFDLGLKDVRWVLRVGEDGYYGSKTFADNLFQLR